MGVAEAEFGRGAQQEEGRVVVQAEVGQGEVGSEPGAFGVTDQFGAAPGEVGEVAPGAAAAIGLPGVEGAQQGVAGEGAGGRQRIEDGGCGGQLGMGEDVPAGVRPGGPLGIRLGQAEGATQFGGGEEAELAEAPQAALASTAPARSRVCTRRSAMAAREGPAARSRVS
ncbi:MAG TPA: hypothetical protein PLL39_11365 [Rhodocyclaceae bacterium]|nr:hypothetical protein [Rhodocyclaceae bacterium]